MATQWTHRSAVADAGSPIRRRPVALFYALTLTASWGVWIPMALRNDIVGEGARPTHFAGLLGPMVGAVLATLAVERWAGLRELLGRMGRWRVAPRWYLAAVSPLLFLVVGLAVHRLMGGEPPALADFGRFGGLPGSSPLVILAWLVVVNGFGEETGWRGFALERLGRTHAPLTAGLLVAVMWALWHAPAFFVVGTYRALPPAALPMFFLGLTAGSVVLTWLYHRSGGSILLVALWHGLYNFASGTLATQGTVAAVASTLVMVQGIALAALELAARRRTGRWGVVLGRL